MIHLIKRRPGLQNKYRCLEEVQSGMTTEVRPNEEIWNEFYDVKNFAFVLYRQWRSSFDLWVTSGVLYLSRGR